jgi:hypothetical protein
VTAAVIGKIHSLPLSAVAAGFASSRTAWQ